jgi:hypothetical protein
VNSPSLAHPVGSQQRSPSVQVRAGSRPTEVHGDWLSSTGLAVTLAVRLSFGMGKSGAAGCTVRTTTYIDQGGTPTGAMPERDMKDRPPDEVAAARAVSGWLQAEAGSGPEAVDRWLEGFDRWYEVDACVEHAKQLRQHCLR